jgi:drug/metabolite transporter (DMT)-like permease
MFNRAHFSYSFSVLSLFAAAILWSTGGFLIKLVSWNPVAIAGMRSAIGALFMLMFIKKPQFHFSFPQLGGAICYSTVVLLFVIATKLTTAANAIILQYTAPIYTAIFAGSFLKERTDWSDWIAVLIVFSGVVLFFLDDLDFRGYYGIIIALCSGIATAWLGLFLRKQKDASPIDSIVLGNIITALVGLPFIFFQTFSVKNVLGLMCLGTFQIGLSYILYSHAIKQVRALDAMLIFMIEPILNPIWVFLIIGERPGFWALIGGCVVIAGVTARSFYALKKSRTL